MFTKYRQTKKKIDYFISNFFNKTIILAFIVADEKSYLFNVI